MKKAIKFLATKNIKVSASGSILSRLPKGLNAIELVDQLENETMHKDFCYTIINNKLEKIEI